MWPASVVESRPNRVKGSDIILCWIHDWNNGLGIVTRMEMILMGRPARVLEMIRSRLIPDFSFILYLFNPVLSLLLAQPTHDFGVPGITSPTLVPEAAGDS